MTGQSPPTLWLACGLCGNASNLARATPVGQGAPRPRYARPLPGDEYVVFRRGEAGHVTYPGKGGAGFTHVFTCPDCKRPHKVSQERLAGWWDAFIASGKRRDTIWLGRDKLCAVLNGRCMLSETAWGAPVITPAKS